MVAGFVVSVALSVATSASVPLTSPASVGALDLLYARIGQLSMRALNVLMSFNARTRDAVLASMTSLRSTLGPSQFLSRLADMISNDTRPGINNACTIPNEGSTVHTLDDTLEGALHLLNPHLSSSSQAQATTGDVTVSRGLVRASDTKYDGEDRESKGVNCNVYGTLYVLLAICNLFRRIG